MSVKITYNSPVILTFSLICAGVLLCSIYIKDLTPYLALSGRFDWAAASNYLNLFTYPLAHATSMIPGQSDFGHFLGNFTILLLIGPVVEEKYGAKRLIVMMLVASVATGFINVMFTNSTILGSSGLAFMMIILGSFTNYSKGDLPLTFIIICIFFLGNEVIGSFQKDNVSQLGHIAGGIIGAVFGFRYSK